MLGDDKAAHRVQPDGWLANAWQYCLDKLDIGARHSVARRLTTAQTVATAFAVRLRQTHAGSDLLDEVRLRGEPATRAIAQRKTYPLEGGVVDDLGKQSADGCRG